MEGGWGWGHGRVVTYYAQSETEYSALLASFKSQQGSAVSTIYSRLWFVPPTAAARVRNSSEGEGRGGEGKHPQTMTGCAGVEIMGVVSSSKMRTV